MKLLGPESIAHLDERMKIRAALQEDALQNHNGPTTGLDRQVAVVSNRDILRTLRGVTSRRRLLKALLP